MTIHSIQLRDAIPLLDDFFSEFSDINRRSGGDAAAYQRIMDTKYSRIQSGDITGIILVENDMPRGIAWVERSTPTYGNIFFHVRDRHFGEVLVSHFLDSGLARGVMSELVQFETGPDFGELLVRQGLFALPRSRQACHLSRGGDYPKAPTGFSLLPLGLAHADEVVPLSVAAHRISRDYPNYQGMETEAGRLAIETLFHSGHYGPVIAPATLGLIHDNRLAAIILNVQTSGWGVDRLPWIFDVATHPDYMGQGLGEWLLQYTRTLLGDLGYTMWGLAVTESNVGAHRVYDRNGFEFVDAFVEYLQP